MTKNPFSIYDFLGYVFPGAVCIIFINFLLLKDNITTLNDGIEAIKSIKLSLDTSIIIILLSYVIGHIMAYTSSVIVESFIKWNYGYPSEYLLNDVHDKKYFDNKNDIIIQSWHIIVFIILLPISVLNYIFSTRLGGREYLIKQLDDLLKECINIKFNLLMNKLNLSLNDDYRKYDYTRIIYHYIYEHHDNHCKKIDNYVALYGFLRSLTLIFCFIFWIIIISQAILIIPVFIKTICICGIVNILFNKHLYMLFFAASLMISFYFDIVSLNLSIPLQFSPLIFISLITITLFSYISFMGFAKFYRRYTLECFMCLITDPNIK